MRKPHASCVRLSLLGLFLSLLPTQAQPAPTLTSHEKVARQFFSQAGGPNLAKAGADAILAGVIAANPQLANYQNVFRDWYGGLLSSPGFESDITRLYMKHFSEREMRELMAFFQTPLGRKALRALPALVEETLVLGEKRAGEHRRELEEKLSAAIEADEEAEDPSVAP